MKKISIIGAVALMVGLSVYFFQAKAHPQAGGGAYMWVKVRNYDLGTIYVSTSDGQYEEVKLNKPKREDRDFSQVMAKLKEFEGQGWKLVSFTSVTPPSVGGLVSAAQSSETDFLYGK